jgi:hypothetical protein
MNEWIRALMEPIEQMRRPIRDIRVERKAAEDAIEAMVRSGGSAAAASASSAAGDA